MKRISTRLFIATVFTAFMLPSFAITFTEPSASSSVEVPRDTTATLSKEKIEEALREFKSLSKHERKERIKEAKKTWKEYKAEKRAGKAESNTNTVLLCILAILLPPLAVYLYEGEVNTRFWISIILTLLFWIPGIIYALVLILSKS
jgi:uncharacterized membrane protein YqaE (UPF0057 family)